MKILLGLDDSAQSKAGLDHVLKLKWPADTRFMVVTAASPIACPPATPAENGWAEAAEGEMHQRAREISARAEAALRAAGLTVGSRVLPGDPGEILVRVAGEWDADLVILGSHGRARTDRFLDDGVAGRVLAGAPCTVMVMKLKRAPLPRSVPRRRAPLSVHP